MKIPSHGPTEILRTPDDHYILVTRNWWRAFLKTLDLESTGTVAFHRKGTRHGLEAVPKRREESGNSAHPA